MNKNHSFSLLQTFAYVLGFEENAHFETSKSLRAVNQLNVTGVYTVSGDKKTKKVQKN